ncbi:acyl-CoA dehydrogenase family protein [Micromonospora sp. FIMYZ51]|uniref:acyl-CoA dehydrogenase family protein n=1 Tax=Micromonospora sp. FIMYZ51 TaxID=3051832 RepID=UPI00311F037C
MDFTLTTEQQALRDVAVKVAAGTPPGWPELVELGWFDPELPALETALIGESCAAATGFGAVLLTQAYALPAYRRAGRSPTAPTTHARPDRCRLTVTDGRVSGTAHRVPYVEGMTSLLVSIDDGPAAGVYELTEVTPAEVTASIDTEFGYARYTLTDAPAERILDYPDAARSREHSWVQLAAQAVGIAQTMVTDAAGYARERVQFGRPIGSFQAVSHRLVDAYASIELARSLVYRAAWALDADDAGPASASAAVVAAERAAIRAGEAAIQTHGAYGFTWDGPVNRHYRRARWIADAHEPAAHHRDLLVAELLAG